MFPFMQIWTLSLSGNVVQFVCVGDDSRPFLEYMDLLRFVLYFFDIHRLFLYYV